MGQRVLRVLDDRPLEELDRLQQAFLGALVEVVAALQVEVAGGEVVGLRGRAAAATASGFKRSATAAAICRWRGHGFLRRRRRRASSATRPEQVAAGRRPRAAWSRGRARRAIRTLPVDDAARLRRGRSLSPAVVAGATAITRSAAIAVKPCTISSRRPRQKVSERLRRGCDRRADVTTTVLRPASAVAERGAPARGAFAAAERRRVAALGQLDRRRRRRGLPRGSSGPAARAAAAPARGRSDRCADRTRVPCRTPARRSRIPSGRRRARDRLPTMKLMNRLRRSTWGKVLLARIRLNCCGSLCRRSCQAGKSPNGSP